MGQDGVLQSFEVFGNYTLLERIAYGGMASVFLARPSYSNANGRLLVIKRVLPQIATDPEFVKMFRAEIQVCMGFNHPNIVQLFDFGTTEGQPYIAMEYIEGKNVRQIAARFADWNEPVPMPVALSIASQAAAGLHYAHTFKNPVTGEELNTIHRDVSPQNILVTYEGNVKVIDFGIAKSDNQQNSEATRTGMIKGKLSYLSPEQVSRAPLDGRSDVFSLGIVLWEMLAGRRLFALEGSDELRLLLAIQKCDQFIQPPSKFTSAIPPELDAIVMKALAKSPDERYQNAWEFQQALREYLLTTYPGFGYADVAQTMKAAFQNEISTERDRIRNINAEAQSILSQREPVESSASNDFQGYIPKFISAQGTTNTGIHAVPRDPQTSMTRLPPAAADHQVGQPPAPPSLPTGGFTGSLYPPVGGTGSLSPASTSWWSFPSITRAKLLIALLFVSFLWLVQTDREYMLLERFFLPTDVIREASGPERVTSGIRFVAAAQAATSDEGVTDVTASGPKPGREALLRIDVIPKDRRSGATFIKVDGRPVNAAYPLVRVPMDRPLSIRVQRKAYADYKGELTLKSTDANPKTKVYRLPVKLLRRGN